MGLNADYLLYFNIFFSFRCIWYSCAHHFRCPWGRSWLYAWLGTQLPFLVLWPGFCWCRLQLCFRRSFSGRGPHHSKERDCSGETISYGAESLNQRLDTINKKKIINAHASWHCPTTKASVSQYIYRWHTYFSIIKAIDLTFWKAYLFIALKIKLLYFLHFVRLFNARLFIL